MIHSLKRHWNAATFSPVAIEVCAMIVQKTLRIAMSESNDKSGGSIEGSTRQAMLITLVIAKILPRKVDNTVVVPCLTTQRIDGKSTHALL